MKLLQKILKYVLPLLFGIGIFWFLTRKIDMAAVGEVIGRGISWTWVIISLVLALFSHIVRGLRWRIQLEAIGSRPSAHCMAVSIFGNYGLNLVFPRLGEVWRCNYIAQTQEVPFTTVVGTMISERMADMLLSLLIALLAFVLQSHVFFDFFEQNGAEGSPMLALLRSPWPYAMGVVLIVGAVLCRRMLKGNRLYEFVATMVANVWRGILSVRNLRQPGLFVGYSLAIWGLYFLNTYAQIFFFDFTSHLGLLATLAIFVMGSLSLIVPVQGGLGAWHAAVIFTLGCYGIPQTEAFSFALVSWAIEQGFVLLLGLYALIVVLLKGKGNRAQ